MIKNIKIKPIFGGHQIYQEIVNYPPEGVEYLGVSSGTKGGKYYESKRIKERFGRWLQIIKLPRMFYAFPGDYDLIHSSRGIIPLNRKPWVMDMEHVHSFFGLNPEIIKDKFWKRYLERKIASKFCKGILCHCEATRQAFFHYLDCSKFKEKIQVLYPSSHIIPLKKEKHKKIRILSILSNFNGKAGPQVLKVFSKIEKKYPNVEFWIRADVPEELKKRVNLKNVRYMRYFGDIIPREQLLREIYSQCDILFYPTLTDSFGYSLIDAMIAKMPIVGTNLFAIPEIVRNGENGIVVKIPSYRLNKDYIQSFSWKKMNGKIEKKFIEDCYTSLVKLIKDKYMRERMGKNGFKRISEGDLSIEVRNRKLRKIYEEALK
jgi:glycosyltransferase involved in cell wall biosynthesis